MWLGSNRHKVLQDVLCPARKTHVVDVGANPVNHPPYALMSECGTATVVGFEPEQTAFEALGPKQKENERYLPYAVGDGSAGEFKVCESPDFSSLLEPDTRSIDFLGRWAKATKVVKRLAIETKRLDDIEEIQHMDLLKIDIQGGELAVFQNSPKKLSKAVAVITEVGFFPLYRGQPLLDQQMKELLDQGFILHKFLFAKSVKIDQPVGRRLWRLWHSNQLVDGDAVFIRDIRNAEECTNEDLKHLALVADGAFQSFDLVMACLGILQSRGEITDEQIKAYLAALKGNWIGRILHYLRWRQK